jgi:hypothetical protein
MAGQEFIVIILCAIVLAVTGFYLLRRSFILTRIFGIVLWIPGLLMLVFGMDIYQTVTEGF